MLKKIVWITISVAAAVCLSVVVGIINPSPDWEYNFLVENTYGAGAQVLRAKHNLPEFYWAGNVGFDLTTYVLDSTWTLVNRTGRRCEWVSGRT